MKIELKRTDDKTEIKTIEDLRCLCFNLGTDVNNRKQHIETLQSFSKAKHFVEQYNQFEYLHYLYQNYLKIEQRRAIDEKEHLEMISSCFDLSLLDNDEDVKKLLLTNHLAFGLNTFSNIELKTNLTKQSKDGKTEQIIIKGYQVLMQAEVKNEVVKSFYEKKYGFGKNNYTLSDIKTLIKNGKFIPDSVLYTQTMEVLKSYDALDEFALKDIMEQKIKLSNLDFVYNRYKNVFHTINQIFTKDIINKNLVEHAVNLRNNLYSEIDEMFCWQEKLIKIDDDENDRRGVEDIIMNIIRGQITLLTTLEKTMVFKNTSDEQKLIKENINLFLKDEADQLYREANELKKEIKEEKHEEEIDFKKMN